MSTGKQALVNGSGDPHNPAFSAVVVPPAGTKIPAQIVHIESLTCFFMVPKDELTWLNKQTVLLKALALKSEPIEPSSCPAICLAMHPDDGEWYRATALARPNDSSCLVKFIDYGNCAVVPAEFVCVAKQRDGLLSSTPAAALECALADCEHIFYGPDALASFKKLLNRNGLTVEFAYDQLDNVRPVRVRLSINEKDVLQHLPRLDVPLAIPRRRIFIDQAENIAGSGPFDATISVASVGANGRLIVWLQRSDRQAELDQLLEALEPAAAASVGFYGELAVGDFCIGHYEDAWYRARVESIDQDSATAILTYIDYGNTETNSLGGSFQQIRRLPSDETFAQPAFAYRAELAPPPDGRKFKSNAGELLVAMTEQAEELEGDNEDAAQASSIRLSVSADGQIEFEDAAAVFDAIAEEVIRDIIPDFDLSKDDIEGVVAFDSVLVVADLAEDRRGAVVWLQRDSDQEALASLQEALEAAAPDAAPLADIQEGDVCMGIYEGAWYRARVISPSSPVCVLFVDYGNVESGDFQLRSLPPGEVFRQPAFALRCRLDCLAGRRFKADANLALIRRTEDSDRPLLVSVRPPSIDVPEFVVELDNAENHFLMEITTDSEAADDEAAAVDEDAAEEANNDDEVKEAADEVGPDDEQLIEDIAVAEEIAIEDGDNTIVESENGDKMSADQAAAEEEENLVLSAGDIITGKIFCEDTLGEFYVRRTAAGARLRLAAALAAVPDECPNGDAGSCLVLKSCALLSHGDTSANSGPQWRRIRIESVEEHAKSVGVLLIDEGEFLDDVNAELIRPMPDDIDLAGTPPLACCCRLDQDADNANGANKQSVGSFEIVSVDLEDDGNEAWPVYTVRPAAR